MPHQGVRGGPPAARKRSAPPGRRDPEGSLGFFRQRTRPPVPEMIAFIDAGRARFGVERICKVLSEHRQGGFITGARVSQGQEPYALAALLARCRFDPRHRAHPPREHLRVRGALDVACAQTRRLGRGARTIPSLAVEGDLPDSRRASRLPRVGDNLERSWDRYTPRSG